MRSLYAAPLLAVSAHIFEEFVWPGGFKKWYASYRPEIAASLTSKLLTVVNGVLLAVCALLAVADVSRANTATWLIIVSILFWNAVFHARAVLRMRRYSPGVVTGVALYVPLAVVSYAQAVRLGLATVATAAACFGVGSVYHVWSLANHKRRARRTVTS
jgi:uncharacterized membrane protein HdeD (DUF308 family)